MIQFLCLSKRGSVVILALFVMMHVSHAQSIVVPTSISNASDALSEVNEKAPSLSFVDSPARWRSSYFIDGNKAKQCVRRAKTALKKKRYMDALGLAAKCVEYEPKPRTEKKALEILKQSNVSLAQKEYEGKLKQYPDTNYENWRSAKKLYNRMWLMQKYNLINGMLSHLEHPKVKLDVKLIDSHVIGELATKISDFRMRAAEEYYAGGQFYLRQGHKNNDKESFKRAYLAFFIANQFVIDFKDAQSQYEAAKKLAIITVYISSHYETSGGFARMLDEDVKAELQKVRGFSGLPFVEITNSKNADYKIQLVANGLELTTRAKTTDKQEFRKEIKDDKGNVTATKIASVTTYTSGKNARAKINISVVERMTNKVIYSTSVERTYEWVVVFQKSSGDLSFVKNRYKKHIGKSSQKAPEKRALYERAIALCAQNIAHNLYINFLRRVGSAPTH